MNTATSDGILVDRNPEGTHGGSNGDGNSTGEIYDKRKSQDLIYIISVFKINVLYVFYSFQWIFYDYWTKKHNMQDTTEFSTKT